MALEIMFINEECIGFLMFLNILNIAMEQIKQTIPAAPQSDILRKTLKVIMATKLTQKSTMLIHFVSVYFDGCNLKKPAMIYNVMNHATFDN